MEAGGLDRAAYSELASLGLAGLYVGESHGGLGMGCVEAMVAMEELGHGLVLEPLPQTLIASRVIAAHAPEAVKAQWLPAIASGDKLVVLAHQERKARWRLDVCETLASQAAGGWTLTGAKGVVPGGDRADAFIVPALAGGHMGLWLVERGAPGVQASGYLTQDGSRAGELRLPDAAATLLTRDGLPALEYAVDVGIAALCAEGVGVMDRTMELTVEYLNTRRQFGVPIASFQALRHRVADMKMQLELARSMSYYASLKLEAPADERRRALSRAKYQLGMSMRFIGQNSVQLHGGIGVTDEYVVSHCFKRLTQMELSFGDSLYHLGEVTTRM